MKLIIFFQQISALSGDPFVALVTGLISLGTQGSRAG